MINKIVDGIVDAINIEFGDEYEIYTESIEQGLEEPCFSILILNPTDELFLNNKHMRTNKFMIQYFPSTSEKNKECSEVLERLYSCLELIYVGDDLTRGSNMSGEIIDEVLNFEVNYDMFVYRVTEEESAMEILETDFDARRDDE
jgi:hypothetical protein